MAHPHVSSTIDCSTQNAGVAAPMCVVRPSEITIDPGYPIKDPLYITGDPLIVLPLKDLIQP